MALRFIILRRMELKPSGRTALGLPQVIFSASILRTPYSTLHLVSRMISFESDTVTLGRRGPELRALLCRYIDHYGFGVLGKSRLLL